MNDCVCGGWNSIVEFDNGSKTTIGDRMIECMVIIGLMLFLSMITLITLIWKPLNEKKTI